MNEKTPQYYIEHLGLEPHPEGGFYKSTFQSDTTIPGKERRLYTSIYFLLRSEDISHLHRLKSDELWYFHGGSPLTVQMIDPNGHYVEKQLGLDLLKGQVPQVLVPKGTIFGSSVMDENTFSLVGCMVSPGFDFEDFQLFTQDELINEFPHHESIIKKMAYAKK